MKTKICAVIFVLSSFSISFSACTSSVQKADASEQKTYVCPMDTDITSNKPDRCTKCGMDLVEKKDNITKK